MKIAIISIVIFGLMTCDYASNHKRANDWRMIINEHMERYPEMQSADIYKLVYQGIRGPGHLGTDAEILRKYLNEEMSNITSDPDIKLMENISPDSEFVRINLEKFKSLELPVEMLVQTIICSSRNLSSERKTLIRIWEDVKNQTEAGRIQIDRQEFLEFHQFIEENNYPVVHHSELYKQRYFPAYRVVSKSVWEDNIKHYLK